MNIRILTLFDKLYADFLGSSIIGKAIAQEKISIATHSLFEMVQSKERIDAPTYGHGPGMVIKAEVYERAFKEFDVTKDNAHVVFFSPHGKKLTQTRLVELQRYLAQTGKKLVLCPARYEGVDARVEEVYADEIISCGDVVLMGGDIPAMLLIEGLVRLVPGVLGNMESAQEDSFTGPFVDHPHYAAPVVWHDKEVPAVLRSGDHKAMQQWRLQSALTRTLYNGHFDWYRRHPQAEEYKNDVLQAIPPHYAVLMHNEVKVNGTEGTTSVTSIDVHDIARSAKTYGFEGYYVVTKLEDQRSIVNTLLSFWKEGPGTEYNVHRHSALHSVECVSSWEEVVSSITKRHGIPPISIVTSALKVESIPTLSYDDQDVVWSKQQPVIFVFGTGHGLTDSFIKKCHYVLPPLKGLTNFNHLSVRSAAAIIFDRWLGLQKMA